MNENGLTFAKWCYAIGLDSTTLTKAQRTEYLKDWKEGIDPSEIRITPIKVSQ